jgi:hypothetical protein
VIAELLNIPFGAAEIRSADFRRPDGQIEKIRADLTGIILLITLERLSSDEFIPEARSEHLVPSRFTELCIEESSVASIGYAK